MESQLEEDCGYGRKTERYNLADCEDGGRGQQARTSGGTGKGKGTDSPLKPPEWNAALTFTLILGSEIILDF